MSDNPYAPPKSLVVDAEPEQTLMARPTQITTAIWLAAISYGMGLVVVLFSWDYYSRLQTMGAFLGSQLFSLLILIWIYYKIYVGRNWARIVPARIFGVRCSHDCEWRGYGLACNRPDNC